MPLPSVIRNSDPAGIGEILEGRTLTPPPGPQPTGQQEQSTQQAPVPVQPTAPQPVQPSAPAQQGADAAQQNLSFLSRPDVKAALIQFGISALTPGSTIGTALGDAGGAAGRYHTQQRERAQQQREETRAQEAHDANVGLARARTDALTGTTKTSRILPPEELATRFPAVPEGAIIEESDKGGLIVRFQPTSDETQREQKIQSLTQTLTEGGVQDPVGTAIKLVDGTMSVEINEQTGKVLLIDEAAAVAGLPNAVTELPIHAGVETDRTLIGTNETLYSLSENASGLRSAVLSATGRIPGTRVGESEQEVLRARSRLKQFANDLARSLVHNPRFPVAERTAVLEAMDLNPTVFDNPTALRVRMRAASENLKIRLAQFERDAADPALDIDTRASQQTNASIIRNALEILGVPEGAVADELTVETVESMSQVHVKEIVNTLSVEELDSLPENVRQILMRKLR